VAVVIIIADIIVAVIAMVTHTYYRISNEIYIYTCKNRHS
jgi:hypothetical protein